MNKNNENKKHTNKNSYNDKTSIMIIIIYRFSQG